MERAKQELDLKRSQLEEQMEQQLGKRRQETSRAAREEIGASDILPPRSSMSVEFPFFLAIHTEGAPRSSKRRKLSPGVFGIEW